VLDVTVGPSPDWMQARLKAGGVRPISNIVDVTNYVLLELGQPMHAFDAAKLTNNEIRVRTARDGERLKTLDGQDRALTGDMLVIADGTRPVGIAGVMGGADSEVTDATRSIVLESAYFNPLSVRRTSRKLGLKTEASTRFERGTDRMLPGTALRRASALLEQIGAAQPRATVIAGSATDVALRAVALRRHRVTALLGVSVPDEQISRILVSLGFDVTAAADGWSVTVPARRVDVAREVDLIEEIARHNGFDKIPGRFPALRQASAEMDPRITRARQLRAVMTGAGFSEANSFGFIARALAEPFGGENELVAIANPLSENFGVLRPSLLPGLVSAVAHNRHREQRDVRLFEIGSRFHSLRRGATGDCGRVVRRCRRRSLGRRHAASGFLRHQSRRRADWRRARARTTCRECGPSYRECGPDAGEAWSRRRRPRRRTLARAGARRGAH
jgi:phenylalanyl-tRNA synthetase beta chain